MIIRTDGLEIEVIRKRIKNMHLHIDRFMPGWREIKKELNAPLRSAM